MVALPGTDWPARGTGSAPPPGWAAGGPNLPGPVRELVERPGGGHYDAAGVAAGRRPGRHGGRGVSGSGAAAIRCAAVGSRRGPAAAAVSVSS